jgi:hypothetical protein
VCVSVGLNKNAELLNGRLAMLGLVVTIITSVIQVGRATIKSVIGHAQSEAVCCALYYQHLSVDTWLLHVMQ